MQKKGIVTAVFLGIVLVCGYILTGTGKISAEDKEIYKEALSMQSEVDKLGLSSFRLKEYKVAMYDGEDEYVFYNNTIEKRKPVLETFAGTAYPVGDHFEVIVPTLDKFNGLLSLTGGVEGMVSGSGYEKQEQISTIWHEAVHAWQLTHFSVLGERMDPKEMKKNIEEEDGESMEALLVREVDKNPAVKAQIEAEMKLLEKAAFLGDKKEKSSIDEMKEAVLEYKNMAAKRRSMLSKEAVTAEQQCELTEGTAYYVEGAVFRAQKGDEPYEEKYLQGLGTFSGGRGKYYRSGMAKCLILDVLQPQWKDELDFSKSLDSILEGAVNKL